MASAGRGCLFILNVKTKRCGSEYDSLNLRNTFEAMGADVEELNDPTGRDTRKLMMKIYKKDFSDYLYCAVAYFSHGTEDDLVGTALDKELINVQKSILIPLCNIKTLDGKLKWVILQNCRGSYDFAKLTPEGPEALVKYPEYYAKFFATSPGMRAYRTENGSFFIYFLCKRLEQEYKKSDIMTIFENVKLDIKNEFEENKKFESIQLPDAETNFPGKLFFITEGFKEK